MQLVSKTLTAIALTSAFATAATAETAMEFAYRHFNAEVERASDTRRAPDVPAMRVTVSSMGNSALSKALRILNQDADNSNQLIGVNGLTLIGGQPARSAEIFERMREESRGSD